VITNEQFLSISRALEQHHAIFYALWEMGRPVFTDSIETAAVSFNKEGQYVQFLFNPKFWEESDDYTRLFVICHESLHVILKHGLRCRDTKDRKGCNYALDVVVNHTLTRSFEFDRKKIQNQETYCWVDTVFPEEKDMPTDQAFEFYYTKLPEPEYIVAVLVEGAEGHDGLANSDWDEVIDKLNGKLSDDEKNSIKDMIEKHFEQKDKDGPQKAGTGQGGVFTFAQVGEVKKKQKWETVIKKWARKYDRPDLRDVEQWARLNRRFVNMAEGLMLPTEMEVEFETEGRIQVWFFQDTSGSCAHFRDRFFKAAMSLNPARFDVKMHCFDTAVYETTLESKKLYGFGGTAFQPIENYIQQYMKKNEEPYPKAVFVITDGWGSSVNPAIPERWYWFLSQNHTYYIPKKSNTYMLKDFE
jgi:hypothetical protein